MKAVAPIWQPRDDQKVGVEFALGREAAGIFAKPGVGKTAIFLKVLYLLKQHGEGTAAIVVVPLRALYATWPAEVAKWAFPYSVGILHGPKKAQVLTEKHDIYLVNPEGVDWLTDQVAHGHLPRHVDTLCVDESTKFKNSQAKRFKYLAEIIHRFKNRYILTGTPQTRSLEDLWSQVYLLDAGKRLGKYITHFRRQFMVNCAPPMAAYSDWQPARGARERVYALISDICITMPSPRTVVPLFNKINVVMPPKARDQYATMLHDFHMQMAAGQITAANAGVKSMKLRQITGGFVYDDAKVPHLVHEAKLDSMVDFIEELGDEPLLVAVNFDHEAQAVQARIKKEFGLTVPYFGGGGLKGKEAAAAVDAWNAGRTRVLVANPQSAAHGLNLQHGGNNVLWYSLTYNWEDYEQFNARLDRMGQKNTVVISLLMADNTIDHLVLSVLDGRGSEDTSLFTLMRQHHEQASRKAA